MALNVVQTPRDKLDRLADYAVKVRRRWWIVGIFIVLGGALSVAFAITRPHVYETSAVLFYQERIQTSLLQGRDAATMQRNIGERYRELLLARSQLSKIIEDPELNPFPDLYDPESKAGLEEAVEELRLAIDFQVRGANTFRIVYRDSDRVRARDVTRRLTQLLIEKERDLRLEQGEATVKFAQEQLDAATEELRKRERARAQFLSDHPEFAEDEAMGSSEGAAVRRRDREPAPTTSNPRLNALERQRSRIRARLAAGNNPAPAPVPQPRQPRAPTAAEMAARQKVDQAEREVGGAQRQVEELRSRGLTDRHPDMTRAKEELAAAQGRLRRAEAELAAVTPADEDDEPEIRAPPTAADRATLERELREVEQQIATERARSAGTKVPTPQVDTGADRIVALEAQWAALRREVGEQTERVETLNDSVFRAQLDAQTRIAEQGSALQPVDEAFLPMKPMGKGKKILVMAGLVVFTGLGLALAVALAIVDDRLYRRVDLEQLGVAPVLGVIPKAPRRARKQKQAR
jgi:uncharacterized protein involved in exopolysaccharide biosynthesis